MKSIVAVSLLTGLVSSIILTSNVISPFLTDSILTVTTFYDACETYCSECASMTQGVSTSQPSSDASLTTTSGMSAETDTISNRHSSGIMTTYTTIYSQTCSTGLEKVTYTVTESCSIPNQVRDTTYVPQGFTVTTVSCTVCGQTPLIATLTTPAPLKSSSDLNSALAASTGSSSANLAIAYSTSVSSSTNEVSINDLKGSSFQEPSSTAKSFASAVSDSIYSVNESTSAAASTLPAATPKDRISAAITAAPTTISTASGTAPVNFTGTASSLSISLAAGLTILFGSLCLHLQV